MKKIKREEWLDEEQLMEDEEHNQPIVEQEEQKDQQILRTGTRRIIHQIRLLVIRMLE